MLSPVVACIHPLSVTTRLNDGGLMRSCKGILLFTVLFSVPLPAQWQSVGNVDSYSSSAGNAVTIHAGQSIVQIRVLADNLVRVRFSPTGVFAPDSSWAVIRKDWPGLTADIVDSLDKLTITTKELSLWIRKKPLRLAFYDTPGNVLNEDERTKGMSWAGSEVRVWKAMPPDEYYYGFGEKAGRFGRKYTHMTMWNSDIPAYSADTDPLYQTIPFFYGIRNGRTYGIFFDNSHWSSFDMGKESRAQYSFGAEGGDLDYYFFSGPAPETVLSRYTELVGRMPLPPRWSLGYQQCRWSYKPESRVREIAKGFRDRKIPCDVIYLDIDHMEGYRIFTWNRDNFPEPKKMISDLAKDGFKIAVIVDPGIKVDSMYHAYRSGRAGNHFLKYPDGRTFTGTVWPGVCAFPDFTSADARAWWGSQFSGLINAGVRGWWNDMNEPSVFDSPNKTVDLNVVHDDHGLRTSHAKNHNVYGMLMTRATYDGTRNLLPGERPFVLTRASYAGGQRYSASWTGDNVSSWEHLRMGVAMCLNLSVSGQPFVGTDIGGFMGYPSGELFARWLQFGVFSPLMRAHSVIDEKNKEPWEYGPQFTDINRETIELRYRLLPYIYTVMHHASVTGIPAMRPLIFAYPHDQDYIWNDTEFMFGDDLLIAPVLLQGMTQRELRLPRGEWYDYWTMTKLKGGKKVVVDAPLNRIPVFVKAGAIIPTQQPVQYSDQAPANPLTFTVFPSSGQSSSSYYEDDGHSFAYEHGEFLNRTITQISSRTSIELALSRTQGSFTPAKRSLVVKFVDIEAAPKSISAGGKKLQVMTGSKAQDTTEGWTYDSTSKTLLLTTYDRPDEIRVLLER